MKYCFCTLKEIRCQVSQVIVSVSILPWVFNLLFVFISSLQLNFSFFQYTYSLMYPHILRNWSLVSRMSWPAFVKINPMLFQEINQLQAPCTKSNMVFLYYLVRNNSMSIAWRWSSNKSQAALEPLFKNIFGCVYLSC